MTTSSRWRSTTVGKPTPRTLNILVAEDNSVNQQVIQGILRHAGHGVHLVDSGEQVLDFIDENDTGIDLLILDMNMPEMNGLDVVKAIRFMDTSNSLPILMLTADGHAGSTFGLH